MSREFRQIPKYTYGQRISHESDNVAILSQVKKKSDFFLINFHLYHNRNGQLNLFHLT